MSCISSWTTARSSKNNVLHFFNAMRIAIPDCVSLINGGFHIWLCFLTAAPYMNVALRSCNAFDCINVMYNPHMNVTMNTIYVCLHYLRVRISKTCRPAYYSFRDSPSKNPRRGEEITWRVSVQLTSKTLLFILKRGWWIDMSVGLLEPT